MAKRKGQEPGQEKKLTKAQMKKAASDIKRQIKSETPKVTQGDILSWLFDGAISDEIPMIWHQNKSKVQSSLEFNIIPSFRKIPKAQSFMNKHVNELYQTWKWDELLIFLKSYIQLNRFERYQLDTKYRPRSPRDEYVGDQQKEFPVSEKGYGDIISEFNILASGLYGAPDEKLKKQSSGKIEDNSMSTAEFDQNALAIMNAEEERKFKEDPRFLQEITPAIIKEYGLCMIDIKVLEEQNKMLIVFVDKKSSKKLYVMDFYYEFYVSSQPSVFYNDYVTGYNTELHTPVICTDYKTTENLRRGINQSREKFFKSLFTN